MKSKANLLDNMNSKKRRIEWKIHCVSPIEKVFHLLNSNEGRKNFWAESADEVNGCIHFSFPNGQTYTSKIVKRIPNAEFTIIYFDTWVIFQLSNSKDKGTDIRLINENVSSSEYEETKAGWVSVLLALKTFADFGIDIRNHCKERNWDTGFVDN
jgi:hypothetical protein